jgi:hypothetical protein
MRTERREVIICGFNQKNDIFVQKSGRFCYQKMPLLLLLLLKLIAREKVSVSYGKFETPTILKVYIWVKNP